MRSAEILKTAMELIRKSEKEDESGFEVFKTKLQNLNDSLYNNNNEIHETLNALIDNAEMGLEIKISYKKKHYQKTARALLKQYLDLTK